VLVLPGSPPPRPARARGGLGGRHRDDPGSEVGDVRPVPRRAAKRAAVGQRRAPRRPRRAAYRGHGLRGAAGRRGRPARDGTPARRRHGRRRLGLLHRPRLPAQRVREHAGADRAGALDALAPRLLLLTRARRIRDAARLDRRGHSNRRRGRGAGADRARQGLRARELVQARGRARSDRRRPPPRRGRRGRRLSVQRRQHEDGQPHAGLGPRGRHGEAARASDRPGGAQTHHRRVPRGRRALGHRLAGRRRLRPDSSSPRAVAASWRA